MKKILFVLVLFSLFICTPKAFSVDVNKINIGGKSHNLIDNLNKTYKIETSDFSKEEYVEDNSIDLLVKELVKITLSSSDISTKQKDFTNYQYYSKDNGGETLATSLLIETYFQRVEELAIKADYIRDIRTVSYEGNVISFVYLGDSTVNGIEDDVILVYWLKKSEDEYRIFYPWLTIGEDMDTFFARVGENENNGEIVSGTYKELTLGSTVKKISNDDLKNVYQNNYNSVVQITGMNKNGSNMYGSGFFIREGVIVTTWSLFLEFLTNSNYIFVNDVNGNTYQVLGVIAAQVDYDVVVLKISQNVGRGVNFGDSTKMVTDDELFMINSKNNVGFSISYGKYISEKNGRIKNMLLLSSSDCGSALFNREGKVIGIALGDKLNSELSYANSTNYLVRLQLLLNSQAYDKISYTVLETFKQTYYTDLKVEKSYNYVNSNIFNKFMQIGDLEKNVSLELIKASYVDKILSLRYKCDTKKTIDTMFLVASYTEKLVLDGYKLTYEDEYKKIYQNNKYKIILKSNLQYLIILIMEK